ncbi:hypothetical protein J4481_01460 [Candidatus Pacearchaeota archaeon]|nr:hypothetical protein [Candidatus Pacearchaeota archaeon]
MPKKTAKKKVTKKRASVKKQNVCKMGNGSCGGCGYGLGFLGSAIYFISTATSFWAGVVGVLKSLVWPAFLVYELMKYLVM